MAGDALKVEDATWDVEVMKASELVMVDFWAVWCGPCQMVAPIIEELGKEYAGKVKVRKLNTDENPEVAGRYQVMSIPTILFFKNGQVSLSSKQQVNSALKWLSLLWVSRGVFCLIMGRRFIFLLANPIKRWIAQVLGMPLLLVSWLHY